MAQEDPITELWQGERKHIPVTPTQQQTATESCVGVQSSIIFLSHTVDRISETCLVVKKSTGQAAAVQEFIAVSDKFKMVDSGFKK